MLRSPVQRARYLLELNGVDAALETNTAMPADFLTRQLELREALEEAEAKKDPGALERLRDALRDEKETLKSALGEQLDDEARLSRGRRAGAQADVPRPARLRSSTQHLRPWTTDGAAADLRTGRIARAAPAAARGGNRSRHDEFARRHDAQRRRHDSPGRAGQAAAAVDRALPAGAEVEVGYPAQAHQSEDPKNTIVSVKRFMGRGRKDVPTSRTSPTISSMRPACCSCARWRARRARSRSRPRS